MRMEAGMNEDVRPSPTECRGHVEYPPLKGRTWLDVSNDPDTPIIVTNNVRQARQLCARGVPAIAVLGCSTADIETALASLGARTKPNSDGGAYD